MCVLVKSPTTWNSLLDRLWENSFDKQANSIRTYTAFHGLSRDYGNLSTTVQRISDQYGKKPGENGSLEWKERRLLDCFQMYERLSLATGQTVWDIMLLGQHHGLPTRLLDWTASPVVALYFACSAEEDWDKDGLIWCVKRLKVHEKPKSMKSVFSLHELADKYQTLDDFDKERPPIPRFFEPPSVSPRIIAQYSVFSVAPGVRFDMQDWLEKNPEVCWKVIIPKSLKPEILRRLAVMNITRRTLFPGLDGTCEWLRLQYLSRDNWQNSGAVLGVAEACFLGQSAFDD